MIEPATINRRAALARMGAGLGTLGLFHSLQAAAGLAPHFVPRAKRVIHLFMNGGPFGPDFLDPKPALKRFEGQRPAGADLRTERPTGGLLAAPFQYARHGRSGLPISELLPHTARFASIQAASSARFRRGTPRHRKRCRGDHSCALSGSPFGSIRREIDGAVMTAPDTNRNTEL